MDQNAALLLLALVIAIGIALLTILFRGVLDALQADKRIAALARALGGTPIGTEQWLANRGPLHAGLLVVRGKAGLRRISLWSTRIVPQEPRRILGVIVEYDHPLRRAFQAGEVERIALRTRSGLQRLLRPSAKAESVLFDLAEDVRISSTLADEPLRALFARPEIRDRVRGALSLGFDELILYPPHGGVELIAHSPRSHFIDPEIMHMALGWIEPLAVSLSH